MSHLTENINNYPISFNELSFTGWIGHATHQPIQIKSALNTKEKRREQTAPNESWRYTFLHTPINLNCNAYLN